MPRWQKESIQVTPGLHPRGILIEGWRSIPHSYAICAAFQALELQRRGDLDVQFRDVPYFHKGWTRTTGLYESAAETRLMNLPAPASGATPDIVYRLSFPFDLSRSEAPRTLVFGTAEYGCVPSMFLTSGRSLRQSLQDSDCRIVTCSNWSREGFLRSGAEPDRVLNIGLGFDPQIFHPVSADQRAEIRRELGWSGFVFLNLGGMAPNKGIGLLLKAAAQVAFRHPEFRLVCKGLSTLYPSQRYLQEGARDLTVAEAHVLQERLIYLDQTLSFASMARLYQAADAYVSPYLAEGFNMPVLEAAACGLPVICSGGGPTDDFTRPEFALPINCRRQPVNYAGDSGIQLQPDPEHLVQQMQTLLQAPDIVARAGTAGPAFVSGQFTWQHVVDRLLHSCADQTTG